MRYLPSPNTAPRTSPIRRIILHSTRGGNVKTSDRHPSGTEFDAAINWLKNPASQVSAHYVVGRNGEVVQLVPDSRRAWHAGEENDDSIGIEVEQPTQAWGFTEEQMASLTSLVRAVAERHGIPMDRSHILGHLETAQGRRIGKTDPLPMDLDALVGRVKGSGGGLSPENKTVAEEIMNQIWALQDQLGSLPGAESYDTERQAFQLAFDHLKRAVMG